LFASDYFATKIGISIYYNKKPCVCSYKKVVKQQLFLLHVEAQQKSLAISTNITTYYNKEHVFVVREKVVNNILSCHILIDNKNYQLSEQKI
jgi:hypothetical protein